MTAVLDTSAVLAALWQEPGAGTVQAVLGDACICAVNVAELIGKLIDQGASESGAVDLLSRLAIEVVTFDEALAIEAGFLRRPTRAAGLSLGDRACLALGRRLDAPVLTADRNWAKLSLGIRIELIR